MRKVEIIGHRGTDGFPENSLEGFIAAIREGADGVECDVVFTKDHVPVVSHDNDLSKMVLSRERLAILSELHWQEVQRLKLNRGLSLRCLDEVLTALVAAGARRIFVHYKRLNESQYTNLHIVRIGEAIRASAADKVAVVMVESGRVAQWRRLAPDIQVLQCWTAIRPAPRYFPLRDAIEAGVRYVGLYHAGRQLGCQACLVRGVGLSRLGIRVGLMRLKRMVAENPNLQFVVFTLNDPELAEAYRSAGVQVIGTDCPAKIISHFASVDAARTHESHS